MKRKVVSLFVTVVYDNGEEKVFNGINPNDVYVTATAGNTPATLKVKSGDKTFNFNINKILYWNTENYYDTLIPEIVEELKSSKYEHIIKKVEVEDVDSDIPTINVYHRRNQFEFPEGYAELRVLAKKLEEDLISDYYKGVKLKFISDE